MITRLSILTLNTSFEYNKCCDYVFYKQIFSQSLHKTWRVLKNTENCNTSNNINKLYIILTESYYSEVLSTSKEKIEKFSIFLLIFQTSFRNFPYTNFRLGWDKSAYHIFHNYILSNPLVLFVVTGFLLLWLLLGVV